MIIQEPAINSEVVCTASYAVEGETEAGKETTLYIQAGTQVRIASSSFEKMNPPR